MLQTYQLTEGLLNTVQASLFRIQILHILIQIYLYWLLNYSLYSIGTKLGVTLQTSFSISHFYLQLVTDLMDLLSSFPLGEDQAFNVQTDFMEPE